MLPGSGIKFFHTHYFKVLVEMHIKINLCSFNWSATYLSILNPEKVNMVKDGGIYSSWTLQFRNPLSAILNHLS